MRTWFSRRDARFQSTELMNDYSDGDDVPIYVSLDGRATSSQKNGGPYGLPHEIDDGLGAGYQDIERIDPARYIPPEQESVQAEVQVAIDVVLAMKLAALEARMAALRANEPRVVECSEGRAARSVIRSICGKQIPDHEDIQILNSLADEDVEESITTAKYVHVHVIEAFLGDTGWEEVRGMK